MELEVEPGSRAHVLITSVHGKLQAGQYYKKDKVKVGVAGEVDGAKSWWPFRGGGYGLNGREE